MSNNESHINGALTLRTPSSWVASLAPAHGIKLSQLSKLVIRDEQEAYMHSTKVDGADGKVSVKVDAFASLVRVTWVTGLVKET